MTDSKPVEAMGEVDALAREIRGFATKNYAKTHPEGRMILEWADRLAALSGGREQPEATVPREEYIQAVERTNDVLRRARASREQPEGLELAKALRRIEGEESWPLGPFREKAARLLGELSRWPAWKQPVREQPAGLRESLRPWLRHKDSCAVWREPWVGRRIEGAPDCDCGLDEALAASPDQESERA